MTLAFFLLAAGTNSCYAETVWKLSVSGHISLQYPKYVLTNSCSSSGNGRQYQARYSSLLRQLVREYWLLELLHVVQSLPFSFSVALLIYPLQILHHHCTEHDANRHYEQTWSALGPSIHSSIEAVQKLPFRGRHLGSLCCEASKRYLSPFICTGLLQPFLHYRYGLSPHVYGIGWGVAP